MAERRMFAKTIIDSDAFLDMPTSAQALYFHLAMRADDDGFLNNPKKVQRMVGASDDDCAILLAKRFLIRFDNGVVVIKHWRIHNYIRSDRYKPTVYQKEIEQLAVKENGSYTLGIPSDNQTSTICIPDAYQMDTQDRLGKDRLGKDRLGKDRLDLSSSKELDCATEVARTIEAWNSLNLAKINKIVPGKTRDILLKCRIREYGIDEVLRAIENIRESEFLNGANKRGWVITFDWFIKPNNFVKVLDGNYANNTRKQETSNPFLKMLQQEGEA